MTFVQAWDEERRAYVPIRVATGEILEKEAQHAPFKKMEEIEPLRREAPRRAAQSDPLRDFR